MAGSVEHHQLAVGQLLVQVLAHRQRGHRVVGALQDQGRGAQLAQVGPVVAQERDAGKVPGNGGVGAAKAVVELPASSGRSGWPIITGVMLPDQPR